VKAFAYVNAANEKEAVAPPHERGKFPAGRRHGSAGADEGPRRAADRLVNVKNLDAHSTHTTESSGSGPR
jgi:hypothetical protein